MQKLTILIIDDSSVMSHFLANFFFKKNYNVISFTDSTKALKAIENGLFVDAIITDLEMPKLSGLQLTKAIRDLKIDTPIAVLTASKESNIRIKCLALGANECIIKPFNPIELGMRIQNLMKKNHLYTVIQRQVPGYNIFKKLINDMST